MRALHILGVETGALPINPIPIFSSHFSAASGYAWGSKMPPLLEVPPVAPILVCSSLLSCVVKILFDLLIVEIILCVLLSLFRSLRLLVLRLLLLERPET